MGKLGKLLKMMILLANNGQMKAEELANELGINLSIHEMSIIDLTMAHLRHNNYIYMDEFEEIADKLKVLRKIKDKSDCNLNYFVKEPNEYRPDDKERQARMDINEAAITQKKVKVKYYSLNSGAKERIIHPYGMYQNKGDMYIAAYCENRNEVRDFKVIRIEEYEVMDTRFEIDEGFNWDNYMKNYIGVYKGGEDFEIELKIYYPNSKIVSEKNWVDNQEIVWNDDRSIIFKAKMRGFTEIKSWILSMGSSVEVIKPQKLREEIREEIKKIHEKY